MVIMCNYANKYILRYNYFQFLNVFSGNASKYKIMYYDASFDKIMQVLIGGGNFELI